MQSAAFAVYDTSRGEPDPRVPTVLRTIECADPVILNALIDAASIEVRRGSPLAAVPLRVR